jgi:hypothetical protein
MRDKIVVAFPNLRKMVEFIKDKHIIIHEYDITSNTLSLPWNEDLLKQVLSYNGIVLEKVTTEQ